MDKEIRIQAATAMLETYAQTLAANDGESDILETQIIDAIADLLLLAKSEDLDISMVTLLAEMHANAETPS